jgi:gamma-glutamyltranspeptidase/glutathione hydrolase
MDRPLCRNSFPVFFVLVFLSFQNIQAFSKTATTATFEPTSKDAKRSDYIAEAPHVMVAAAHHLASAAGAAVMQAGGNAIDAAVATSFVISVVRPHSTGLGGGGFLLYFDKKSGKVLAFDFRERAPIKATRDMYLDAKGEPLAFEYNGVKIPEASVNGHLSIGTPGLVAGLLELHKRYGKLPLKEVMAPAIRIAKEGFPVYGGIAKALQDRREVMKNFEGTTKIFFKGGKPLVVGDLLVQTDLAETLRLVSEKGVDGFYKGRVAEQILAEIKRGKGILSREDLESYKAREVTPIHGTYRGHDLYSMPPPSSGGVHIIQMLNMLATYDLKKLGFHSADHLHLLAEVMRRAFADRAKYLGDPEFVKVPVQGLIDLKYAAQRRDSIDMKKASVSKHLGAGDPRAYESPSTTHLSVVDAEGNAVSSTQTINYSFGSGVVAEGTGVVLNDEMDDFSIKPGTPNVYGLVGSEANAIAARKTMLSSMTPTIVLSGGAKPEVELVVGSPGGPKIINATFQTISNVIDFSMPLSDAAHALRIHHQWLPDVLSYEAGVAPNSVLSTLQTRGHLLKPSSPIGDVQAISRIPKGWQGVSDTRSEGHPQGW